MRSLASAFLALLAACSGSLPSPYEIRDLRVVSIIADKPEVQPGDAVTLTAYFEAPDFAQPNISVLWQMCPDIGALSGDITCVDTPSVIVLQNGQTAALVSPGVYSAPFTYTVPANILTEASPLAQRYGYNEDLLVHGTDPGKSIDADKRVVASTSTTPNTNPILTGFQILEAAGVPPDVFALQRGGSYTFLPQFDASSLETYSVVDYTGTAQSFTEQASFIWSCAPSCTIDRATTYAGDSMSLSLDPDWNFGSTLLINVVMRDGRGGEAFYSQMFNVLPETTQSASRSAQKVGLP